MKIYMYMFAAFSMMGNGKISGRPEGSPGRSIKALMNRKEKRGINGMKEYSLALQMFVSHQLRLGSFCLRA